MVVNPEHKKPEKYFEQVAQSRVKGLGHGIKQVKRAYSGGGKTPRF